MPYAKPEQLDGLIQSGKLGKIYLFDGPENWLKDRAVARIVDRLLPAEARDFNFERLDAVSSGGGQIASSAQSLPFMAERRVIVVRGIEEMTAAEARTLAEALPNVPPSTCLLLLHEGKANLREELCAQAGSLGAIVTFWTPFPNQLPMWIMNETRARGKAMTHDAAQALAEVCDNLSQLSSELDKLCLFVGAKKSIDLQDVRAHGLPDEEGDTRDLEEALWERDFEGALRQGRLVSEAGGRTESVFPVFERVFKSVVLGHYYRSDKRMDWPEIYTALGFRGKTQENNLMKGLKAYTPGEARKALERVVQADYDVKTGALPAPMALSLLILGVCGRAGKALALR